MRELARPDVCGGWRAYVAHRLPSVSLQRSPLDLVQEAYSDPWAHLAACLMCARTTGGAVVRLAIADVLAAYPSPSAVLDAPQAALREALHPLGLQDQRCQALACMSRDFLGRAWQDPSEFKGVGKFCADSWRIFCRGYRDLHSVDDKSLCRYLRWLTKGELEDKSKRTAPAKKRKAEREAEPGTLRSGRRRGTGAAEEHSGGKAAPAPERR